MGSKKDKPKKDKRSKKELKVTRGGRTGMGQGKRQSRCVAG